MSQVKEISETDFEHEISHGVSLVDFNAVWCPPCQMMKPVLQHLAPKSEFQQIGFKAIDVDRNPQIAQQLQIQDIPTFLITKDGRIIDQITGFIPEPLLAQKLRQVI